MELSLKGYVLDGLTEVVVAFAAADVNLGCLGEAV